MPFFGVNSDTLMLNTIRVNIAKSNDSAYHVYKVRFSRGGNPETARRLAQKIDFSIVQKDSVLLLPKGFAISKNEKFRNQQVLIIIEVPVGKRIQLDRSINNYDWFSMNINRRGWNIEWNDNWDNTYGWRDNVEYIMGPDGLERKNNELKKGQNEGDYRYEGNDSTRYQKEYEDQKRKTDEEQRKLKQLEEEMKKGKPSRSTKMESKDDDEEASAISHSPVFSLVKIFY